MEETENFKLQFHRNHYEMEETENFKLQFVNNIQTIQRK